MIIQKMLLAWVVGFLVMFLLAGLFHIVIMKDFFIEKVGPVSSMIYPLISYLMLSFLMSFAYSNWKTPSSTIMGGLIFGIVMGLICRLPWQYLEIGYGKVDASFVITEAVWHAVEQGVGGIAIAMMYARGSKSE